MNAFRDFFLTQFGEGDQVDGLLEDDITQTLSMISNQPHGSKNHNWLGYV
jgi:hypothetical protein